MNSSRVRAIRLTIAAIAASLLLSAVCFAMFAFSLIGALHGEEAAVEEPGLGLVICAGEDVGADITFCGI